VKCKVQNIAVDISVNQIGGPNKVYFLEKVIVFFLERAGELRIIILKERKVRNGPKYNTTTGKK
jgi:hypothetical protein